MKAAEAIFGITAGEEFPAELEKQLQQFDLEMIQKLARAEQKQIDWGELAAKAHPPRAFRVEGENRFSAAEAAAKGRELLKQGQVGMILVAGGQGTRLGFDQPKGLFPIGPVSERTLFEFFIDRVQALGARYGVTIPLYVMTSPATHDETVAYFEAHDSFGLTPEQLTIFCQGTMPAVDAATGKLLRASETELALSPNGHGGMLDAFAESGCLKSAAQRGIDYFFYGQIDNPLVQVCDETLLGYHALSDSEMTTQVVTKAHPLEKVGNVVEIDGRVQIIEYSDLPDEYAQKTDDHGEPYLWAGNIAVHVFSRSFLERASQEASSLPFHLAHKKVPYLDENNQLREPESPNAIKFEKFIFDLLPLAKNAIAVEVAKAEGFAPVKNADGAPADTPALAKQAISDLHRRWLESCGVKVAEGVCVEIHPAFALDAEQLAQRQLPETISEDAYLKE